MLLASPQPDPLLCSVTVPAFETEPPKTTVPVEVFVQVPSLATETAVPPSARISKVDCTSVPVVIVKVLERRRSVDESDTFVPAVDLLIVRL